MSITHEYNALVPKHAETDVPDSSTDIDMESMDALDEQTHTRWPRVSPSTQWCHKRTVRRVVYSIGILSFGFFAALFFLRFDFSSFFISSSGTPSSSQLQIRLDEIEVKLDSAIQAISKYREQLDKLNNQGAAETINEMKDVTNNAESIKSEAAAANEPPRAPQLATSDSIDSAPPTDATATTVESPTSAHDLLLSDEESHDAWLRNRTSLINLLQERSAALRSRYPEGMDFTSLNVLYLGTHQRAKRTKSPVIPSTPLTNALTESYLGLRSEQFIIGVTGGSSSPGDASYPALIQSWFSTQLNFEIGIRNGASGSTSQLQTAPCIYQIVGDRTKFDSNTSAMQAIDLDTYLQSPPIDLLLWEFTLNDERMVFHHERGDEFRKVVAETYLRGLFSHGLRMPRALGFVHLWDVTIHNWEFRSDKRIPDLAWWPTHQVRDYYEPYFDSFAVNVIRFFVGQSCIDPTTNVQYSRPPPTCVSACPTCSAKNQTLLRDVHHPSPKGYAVIRDILLHSILKQWIEALSYEVETYRSMKVTQPSLRYLSHEALRMNKADPKKALSIPLLTRNNVLPITNGMRSACIIGSEPLFAPPDPRLRFECDPSAPEDNIPPSYAPVNFTGSDHLNPGFLPVCSRVPRVDFAIWNRHRGDRKMPFGVPNRNCSTAYFGWDRQPPFVNTTTKDDNGTIIHNPEPPFPPPMVIHLRGMNRLRYAVFECSYPNWDCDGLQVLWAGRELKSNVDKSDSVYDSGLAGWMHRFTDEEIQHALGKPTYFTLSYCPSQQAPRLLLYRHSVWYED